jgi:hypothetical protein
LKSADCEIQVSADMSRDLCLVEQLQCILHETERSAQLISGRHSGPP